MDIEEVEVSGAKTQNSAEERKGRSERCILSFLTFFSSLPRILFIYTLEDSMCKHDFFFWFILLLFFVFVLVFASLSSCVCC